MTIADPRPLTILDVAEFYAEDGGGVKTYIHQKLRAGAALGHRVVIVAPGADDKRVARDGGEIIYVKAKRHIIDHRYHVFTSPEPVHTVIAAEKPDVIEGSSAWRGGRYAAAWPGPGVKSFFIHQDPVSVYPQTFLGGLLGSQTVDRLSKPFWRHMAKLAAEFDTSVVAGEWLAERLAQNGVPRPVAVPFGVENDVFTPDLRDDARRRAMLKACGVNDENAVLFVTMSRHHPEKRVGAIIDAFKRIASERPAGLYLIGDGPIRKIVEAKAARTPHVHVAGVLKDRFELAKTLASADVMLHGGAAETFGLAVAEGLFSGLPLVAPEAGGALDLADPTFAELYPPGDAAAFADAIRRILARERTELSKNAAAAARRRIGAPIDHFRALFAHYADLVAQKEAEGGL